MSSIAAAVPLTLARVLPPWWLFLITGISWTIVAVFLLRFDYTTVRAISILFGIVAIAAGILEVGVTMLAQGWWKLLYAVLAVAFIAAGVVSFIHPGDTFVALAAVISFFLVFAGTFDIITSISTRREIEVWWLQLIGGIIELALGFWAAGYYGRSAILLVAWVSAFTLIRGVRDRRPSKKAAAEDAGRNPRRLLPEAIAAQPPGDERMVERPDRADVVADRIEASFALGQCADAPA
jgi:uncharacterized membrane protein HdeD (DUF308 family)